MNILFPKNFLWGAATASYQIEGAFKSDGKGESIWDRFTHTEGKIKNNENGDIAVDHYNRYKEDVKLMSDIKMSAYRFSLAWTRILPEGKGTINQKGIDFYSRLIDELLENNIKPLSTLYHWDLPQKIQDNGGWSNRDTSNLFAEYASIVAKNYGDRVNLISTFNEPAVFTIHGLVDGYMAPGYADMEHFSAAVHHVNLGHGLGLKAMRSINNNLELGCVLNLSPCIPCSDEPADIEGTKLYDMYWNRIFLDPMYKGIYPNNFLTNVEPYLKDGDLNTISQKNDYIGLNHYQHTRVKSDPDYLLKARGAYGNEKPFNMENVELTLMNWEIVPEAYYNQIMELKNKYDNPVIYLTENGCAYPDIIEDGKINDFKRIEFYKKYLSAVKKSIDDGADVRGYMTWTLMDNFEWALGFEKRFGLIHVDFETLKRTPKESYYFYENLIKNNGF